jgi:hypothetical protein
MRMCNLEGGRAEAKRRRNVTPLCVTETQIPENWHSFPLSLVIASKDVCDMNDVCSGFATECDLGRARL